MYKWVSNYNSEKDRIFDYAYLTLYLQDGKVTGGVLNATTDEYDEIREGYVCGPSGSRLYRRNGYIRSLSLSTRSFV